MLGGVQWYLWLLLAVAVIGLIFAWRKVLIFSKERRQRLKKEAAIWKKDYELRQNFSVLTKEKIEETAELNLLHGVAMNIQVFLENQPDMTRAFNELPTEKQFIYALEYFDEDAKEGLSLFFKNNGAPLIHLISPALCAVGYDCVAEHVDTLLPMYDEDSEVSIDYAIIEKVNEEFKTVYDSAALCRYAAKYIKANVNIFLN